MSKYNKTPCGSYGVTEGGKTDGNKVQIDLSAYRNVYGIQRQDPTHTFDAAHFEYLKNHLGSSGFPRTAREAWAQSFKVRR